MPQVLLVWAFGPQCNCFAAQICPVVPQCLLIWTELLFQRCYSGHFPTAHRFPWKNPAITDISEHVESDENTHQSFIAFSPSTPLLCIYLELLWFEEIYHFIADTCCLERSRPTIKKEKSKAPEVFFFHYFIIPFPCPFLKYEFFIVILKLELIKFPERISSRSCNYCCSDASSMSCSIFTGAITPCCKAFILVQGILTV